MDLAPERVGVQLPSPSEVLKSPTWVWMLNPQAEGMRRSFPGQPVLPGAFPQHQLLSLQVIPLYTPAKIQLRKIEALIEMSHL